MADDDLFQIPEAQFGTLELPEPPLAAQLRYYADRRKVCTLHLIDGSLVKGIVGTVEEDGRSAAIDNGEIRYWFDVSALVMIQETL